MAPAEAAQERAESRGSLEGEPEDSCRPAGSKRGCVIDAIAARERRHHEGQDLVPDVRPTDRGTEIEMALDQTLQIEVVGQGSWQKKPSVGHRAIVVEGRVEPVQAVRRSHLSGAPFVGLDGLSQRHLPSSEGHLIRRIRASQAEAIGGSGLRRGRYFPAIADRSVQG